MQRINIYTDGGADNNPGPAGIGVVFYKVKEGEEKQWKTYSKYIGETTNNSAEYKALIFAIKKAKQLLGKDKLKETKLKFYLDSDLVVKQLNAKYKIGEELENLFLKAWNLFVEIPNYTIEHIPREENKEADKLSRQARSKML